MKDLFLRLYYVLGLSSHRISLSLEDIPVLDVKDSSILLNVSSSNNLLEVLCNNQKYYFRFIPERPKRKDVIKFIISRYERLTGADLSTIDHILGLTGHAKSFLRMGDFTKNSNIYKYFSTGDLSLVGLDNRVLESVDKNELISFLYFAWSEICSFFKNSKGGKYQLYSYNRSRCQEVLYELFDQPNLIGKIRLVRIEGNHDTFLGSIMPHAEGVNPLSFKKGELKKRIDPIAIKDLNTLNLLDVLCYERDHRPGNYNVILDDHQRVISVQAFDNDSDLSFSPFFSVSRPLRGCPGLVKKDGRLSISHLDREFALKYLSVCSKDLRDAVKPYLNRIQTLALIIRFRKIKKSLVKTIKENDSFLKDSTEWTESILSSELNSGNNKNYTSLLAEWYEGEKDPVILSQNQWKKRFICF